MSPSLLSLPIQIFRIKLSFSWLIIFCPSRPINRQDSRDHRSPSLHHPECERRRCTGPAAYSRVWSAHGAARQQAGTVQKTDGETGVSTRWTETSTSLRGTDTRKREKSGGEVSVWGKVSLLQKRQRGKKILSGVQMNSKERERKGKPLRNIKGVFLNAASVFSLLKWLCSATWRAETDRVIHSKDLRTETWITELREMLYFENILHWKMRSECEWKGDMTDSPHTGNQHVFLF